MITRCVRRENAPTPATAALGYGGKAAVKLRGVSIDPPVARIGGAVRIGFELANGGRKPQRVLADLVVHFVKVRGTGAKTFKLKALELAPGEHSLLDKKISLQQLTTRKHYPGEHRVEALLNGQRLPLGKFRLRS